MNNIKIISGNGASVDIAVVTAALKAGAQNLEYWNGGFVYNGKRNAVAMLKKYQQKFYNVNNDGE